MNGPAPSQSSVDSLEKDNNRFSCSTEPSLDLRCSLTNTFDVRSTGTCLGSSSPSPTRSSSSSGDNRAPNHASVASAAASATTKPVLSASDPDPEKSGAKRKTPSVQRNGEQVKKAKTTHMPRWRTRGMVPDDYDIDIQQCDKEGTLNSVEDKYHLRFKLLEQSIARKAASQPYVLRIHAIPHDDSFHQHEYRVPIKILQPRGLHRNRSKTNVAVGTVAKLHTTNDSATRSSLTIVTTKASCNRVYSWGHKRGRGALSSRLYRRHNLFCVSLLQRDAEYGVYLHGVDPAHYTVKGMLFDNSMPGAPTDVTARCVKWLE